MLRIARNLAFPLASYLSFRAPARNLAFPLSFRAKHPTPALSCLARLLSFGATARNLAYPRASYLSFRVVRSTTRNLVFITLAFLLCLLAFNSNAQSLYLPQGDKHQQFLERLEIMLQKNPELNIASARTISRHDAVHIAGLEDSSSGNPTIKLTKVDQANLQSLLRNNAEWVTRLNNNKRGFYRNPANMIEVNKEKFFLAVNPMLQAEYSKEIDYNEQVYHYAAGIGIRSMIGAKVGLYASAVRHTERVPSFVLDRVNEYNSLPGAGKVDRFGANGFNYWDVRGGFTFKALKYFDFTVAYDRNFIGNGYRSLFLSDFAKNYVYG